MKKIVLFILVLVVISNLPFFGFLLKENYSYSNIDSSFVYTEEAGKSESFKSCLIRYGTYLCQHPEKDLGDNRLFRTFTIKPWRFWQWNDYIFHSDRFWLPYKDPGK